MLDTEFMEKRRLAVTSLMRADMLHRKVCEKNISALGIHRSQHIMLMRLSCFEGPVTQKEIASELQISAAAAAVTIKKLEDGGYIKRASSGDDKRCNEVEITEKGSEVIARSKAIFGNIEECMTEGMTEQELDVFIEITKKMKENLKGVKR